MNRTDIGAHGGIEELYRHYTRAAAEKGTPLSLEDFAALFAQLSESDRQYWQSRIKEGSVSLTKELSALVDSLLDDIIDRSSD